MRPLERANNTSLPSALPGAASPREGSAPNVTATGDLFAALLKTRLASAPAQELLSASAVHALQAQEQPSSRARPATPAEASACPDLAAIAAQELGQRGDTRPAVEAATRAAQDSGGDAESSSASSDPHVQSDAHAPSSRSRGTPGPSAAHSGDVHTADADLNPSSPNAPSAEAPRAAASSPSPSSRAGSDASLGATSAPPTASSPAAAPSSSVASINPAALAAAVQGGDASRASGPAAPSSTPSQAHAAPTTGTPGARPESSRHAQTPTGPADPRGPRAPGADSSAPGVQGQAMRGVFALLRGTQTSATAAIIKLSPEHLGDVKINLSVSEGRLNATLGVTTDQAHDELKSALPELKESLHARGLIVDSIEIKREPETGQTPDPARGNHDSGGLAGDSRSTTHDERESPRRDHAHEPRRESLSQGGTGDEEVSALLEHTTQKVWLGGWCAVDLTV